MFTPGSSSATSSHTTGDIDLTKFLEKHQGYVCVIRFGKPKNPATVSYAPIVYGSGFLISKNVICTSSHLYDKIILNNRKKQRGGNDNLSFNVQFPDKTWREVKIIRKYPQWNILLLKLIKEDDSICQVTLASNGELNNLDPVIVILSIHPLPMGIQQGYVSCECINCPKVEYEKAVPVRECKDHKTNVWDPKHRLMGHFFSNNNEDPGFASSLDAELPVIQISGLAHDYQGECAFSSSGSPVFNVNGELVGMLLMDFHKMMIAIHVSALKKFVAKEISL